MKTMRALKSNLLFWSILLMSAYPAGPLQAQTNSPAPAGKSVSQSPSTMEKSATVYSIEFTGGTVSYFFKFLQTNGFASDNVLFAGRSGTVRVPGFSVHNVRLRDIAKSLELLSEGRLDVEVQEAGEKSDVNVWRIKLADGAPRIRSRSCPLPSLFRKANAADRIRSVASTVEQALAAQTDVKGKSSETSGSVHLLERERIVVVVGGEAYVEAVVSALEAAEKTALIPRISEKE